MPTQTLTFLGFRLDSLSMTVSPTEEKILKTVEAYKRVQNMTKPQISEVSEVIGLIVSQVSNLGLYTTASWRGTKPMP